jgi:hypothetical protein
MLEAIELFRVRQGLVRSRARFSRQLDLRSGPGRIGQRHDFGRTPMMIERQVMHGSEQPPLRLADLREVGVQAQKRFLNHVFGQAQLSHQAPRVTQQRTLEGCKQPFDRVSRS